MRYPDFLRKNGKIGFAAPSFGCVMEPYRTSFAHALEQFGARGYETVEGPNCHKDCGIGISNTPRACGDELNEMYISGDCDVIISCGGGEMMCEVVPFIDFSGIAAAKPKWYMGYSDNTNFTFLSATLCDTAAIYGPCAPAFGMEPWHSSLTDALMLLEGKCDTVKNYDRWEREKLRDEEHPLLPYNVTEPVKIRVFGKKQKKITGRLIGGCLDCLSVLAGTPYDQVSAFNERYGEEGIIWFLESCDLNLMGIRRAIWQLKEAGWFEHVRGFLIGRPLCYGEETFGIDHYRAFTDLLEPYDVPIVMDADIGHLPPMMPLVCGGTAEISLDQGLAVRYTWK